MIDQSVDHDGNTPHHHHWNGRESAPEKTQSLWTQTPARQHLDQDVPRVCPLAEQEHIAVSQGKSSKANPPPDSSCQCSPSRCKEQRTGRLIAQNQGCSHISKQNKREWEHGCKACHEGKITPLLVLEPIFLDSTDWVKGAAPPTDAQHGRKAGR